MSHQDGLGNNGAEATGLTKPDDGDDRRQKKSENVAHGRNGIKLNKLENSGHLRNSPTTGWRQTISYNLPRSEIWVLQSAGQVIAPGIPPSNALKDIGLEMRHS